MSYTALYRKFRPDTFEDVKGQDHIVTTLKNQIRADRIGHAYLFCGTRGTGKTTIAKILARSVNCEHPVDGSPCNECPTCRGIAAGTITNVIEIDAASNNGVDNIREIREEVSYRPTAGRYKVYIIDEVHMLSTGAFNALLKTLEEPPAYVIFILATTEANRIPVTILSRCQRYDFRRIGIDVITDRLKDLAGREQVEAEEAALRFIAKSADGAMRDALSLLDQCIAFYLGEKLTLDHVLEVLGSVDTDIFSQMLRYILAGNVGGAIRTLEEMISRGKEMTQFVNDFIWYLRNLLMVKNAPDAEEMLDVSSEQARAMKEESRMAENETLMRYIRVLSDLSSQLRYATQKRVLVETCLIRLCRPQMEQNLDAVLDRLRVLEEKMEKGLVAVRSDDDSPGMKHSGTERTEVERMAEGQPAAPQDLQQIAAMWNRIKGQLEHMSKHLMEKSVPRYDPASGGQILYVVPEETMINIMTADKQAEIENDLRRIILQETGKAAELKIVRESVSAGQKLQNISIDQSLAKGIHMEVEYDDDPEDFF